MSHLQIRKVAHEIVKRAYHYMPFTFNCQNDHHLGFVITIDYVSLRPSPTALKSTNDSLRHHFFFLSTYSLD